MSQGAREQGSEETETVRSRIRQYERRERMILWVGAGLVGLIALVAGGVGGSSESVPAGLRALVITAIVVAGGSLAYARVNFEWQATLIKRKIEDGEVQATDELSKLPRELQGWPNYPERAWSAALLAIIISGTIFLVNVWWAAIAQLGCQ
jgi:hypothetical protein